MGTVRWELHGAHTVLAQGAHPELQQEVCKGAQLRPGDFGLSQLLPLAPIFQKSSVQPRQHLCLELIVSLTLPEQLRLISAGF